LQKIVIITSTPGHTQPVDPATVFQLLGRRNNRFRERRQLFRLDLAKIASNWRKSPQIGENRLKLAKIASNWQKSPQIGENRLKLVKLASNWRKSQYMGENRLKLAKNVANTLRS
jgi:hypothetical protein